MALRKVTYVNNQTVISAENLNAIQDAVIALENAPSGGGGGGDGFSPIATVTQTANGAKISITDKNGTTTAEVSDGKDGFSPIATVTQTDSGATISITDKNGTTTATIRNGEGGGGSGGDSVWTEDNGCFKRLVDTKYGSQYEWLNPPMDLNVLYRTAERYNGKPVYKMVFDMTANEHMNEDMSYSGEVSLVWDRESGEFANALESFYVESGNVIAYSLEGFCVDYPDAALPAAGEIWAFYDNGELWIESNRVAWSTDVSIERMYMTVSMLLSGENGEMD